MSDLIYYCETLETREDAWEISWFAPRDGEDGTLLDDDGLSQLLATMEKNPNHAMVGLNLYACELTDEGAANIAEIIRNHPKITRLIVVSDHITDKGAQLIAAAIPENESLVQCRLGLPAVSAEIMDAIANSFICNHHPNIADTEFDNWPPTLKEYGMANKDRARAQWKFLGELDYNLWKTADICSSYRILPAIDHFMWDEGKITERENCDEGWEKLREAAKAEVSIETLTTPGEQGIIPLNNPFVWENFTQVASDLHAQGTPITKALLLSDNGDGEPFLANAIRCGKLAVALNAIEEQLTIDDLLMPDGTHTPVMELIVENHQISALFAKNDWRGETVTTIRKLYNSLPETAQPEARNYHSLLANLARTQPKHSQQTQLSK